MVENWEDILNVAPSPGMACQPGEFRVAAAGLDHNHIFGMAQGLIEAGASLDLVFDPDPTKVQAFRAKFPSAKPANSLDEVLESKEIQLVACASIPSERSQVAAQVLKAGKDFFVDKPPLTTLSQLSLVREIVENSERKFLVYFSERLHNESATAAAILIERGAIGRVLQVLGLGPHRLNAANRPEWFFQRARYGGILCDIGSHQIEQFLFFSGSRDATILSAAVANYHHPDTPELEDFGEASLVGNDGSSHYFRVDWFTPDGLSSWGDSRTIILGTDGYIELRKNVDIGQGRGDQVYLVNSKGEFHFSVAGKLGYPFFGHLIRDCLERTERAMSQQHIFKAAELGLKAQEQAVRLWPRP
ncbi:MAG TPA: Gfo/Idh/MocA family oxidoreductase [Chthoniobacterales bacterium]|jgi:predicted dehydrogenase|nr:Gfo/Idh/MocA family oxidoreductase [Chthoniobacterales bacterium]